MEENSVLTREEIEQLAFLEEMLDDIDETRQAYEALFDRMRDRDTGYFN